MRLLRLTLHNFKGARNLEINPGGESIRILGDNATFKTTVADAITYLLFDKDTKGQSPDNFGIKTRDENGNVLNGLEHSVEGVFDDITLKKVYKENWVKRRGSGDSELSGHTTVYYVDEEPVKMNEYKDRIQKIMSEEQFRMLTMPDYFAEQMHWKDRRDILFNIAGGINTDDIIASYPNLSRYTEVLDGKTEEARTKILKEQKKRLNADLEDILTRIDEASRQVVQVDKLDEAKETIEQLKEDKTKLESKLSDTKSGGGIAELRVKIQDIEADKSELRTNYQQENDKALKDIRDKIMELQDKVDEIEPEEREAKREVESKEFALQSAKEKITKAEKEIAGIKDRQPDPMPEQDDSPDICPMCERPYEEADDHDTEAEYNKYLAEFNQQKAEDLKQHKEMLVSFEQEKVECEKDLQEAKKQASNIMGKAFQRKQALDNAQDQLEDQKNQQDPVEDTQEYQLLEKNQQALQQKINQKNSTQQEQIDSIKSDIKEVEENIEKHNKVVLQHQSNQKIQNRINELNAEREETRDQLEQVEDDLFLIEEFVRARSEFVSDKVNEKFRHVTWRLFKPQINGGIDECAEAIWDGIPFSEGLNNGSRIKAGLDIIETLAKHFGESAPVVIDNRESVTRLPDTDLQIISLIVSKEDKQLRIEQGLEQELELAS